MASVLADYTAHEVFNVHQFAFLRIQLYRHYNSLFCECQENNSLFGECFCLQKSILEVKIVLSIGKQVSDMTIGDKIKKIRTFRKMTQAELGAALGWGEKGANRLAQYETNYRVPKKELVTEMAKILNVNPWTLYDATTMDATEFMELLFWIDEFNPSAINLFQMETYPGEKCNSSEDTSVRYHDNDSWPAHPPVGLWINYGLVNDFMKEWVLRKEELKSGEITRNEYFEWKINWPQTCDGCGKHEPKKQWRNNGK